MPTLTEMVAAVTGLLSADIMLLVSTGAVIGLGGRFISRLARSLR